jgi:soluble lytic murein transglycosylase-like protein
MWVSVAFGVCVRIAKLLLSLLVLSLSVPCLAADYGDADSLSAEDVGEAPQAELAQPVSSDPPLSVSIAMPARLPVTTRVRSTRLADPPNLVAQVAWLYRIDPHLLAALVRTESGGLSTAVSRRGALGLMQVMPATARSLGVADPRRLLTDPRLALEVGATYLKMLQAQLGDDVRLVLAGYNAGPGAVIRAGMRIPAYRETQSYVARVMADYAVSRAAAMR